MKRITAKKMLELWDILLQKEWMKDAGLAATVGLNPSTIASWRSGRNKTAHPYNVKVLSDKLGYEISLEDDKWVVVKANDKRVPVPEVLSKESEDFQLNFSRTAWTSEEEKKKFYDAIKKLSKVDPNDREAIYQIINRFGR